MAKDCQRLWTLQRLPWTLLQGWRQLLGLGLLPCQPWTLLHLPVQYLLSVVPQGWKQLLSLVLLLCQPWTLVHLPVQCLPPVVSGMGTVVLRHGAEAWGLKE
jgi:hypothetical protein